MIGLKLVFFFRKITNSDMESMTTTHTVTPTNTPDTKYAMVPRSRVSAGLKFIYSEKTTKVDEISKLVLTIPRNFKYSL